MSSAGIVAVDWGTTSFRAFLMRPDGTIDRQIEADAGIMQTGGASFEAVLRAQLARLEAPAMAPILASGMITSRQGWVEVPYVACPAGLVEIAAGVESRRLDDDLELHFVPGLSCVHADGSPDVMRGEEMQIQGVMPEREEAALALLPGTHSKWALVRQGRIETFSTFMTGELFAVLSRHSILGRLMQEGQGDGSGFDAGARTALESPAGLLRSLFSVRTLPLMGRIEQREVADYLSGLLLGAEIADARKSFEAAGGPITLIGSPELARRYARTLELAGLASRQAEPAAAARGLFRLAGALGVAR